MKRLIDQFLWYYKTKGANYALKKLLQYSIAIICGLLSIKYYDGVGKRRYKLSRSINTLLHSTVKYGPFKGMKLSNDERWAPNDRSSILLGLYELEVMQELVAISKCRTIFIDFGAADGYYAIGMMFSGLYQKSICFELSELGRTVITSNAKINGVENNVEIYGAADCASLDKFDQDLIDNSAILMDVEGYEFEILTEEFLYKSRNAYLVIELHDWTPRFNEKYDALLKVTSKTHNSKIIQTGSRDLSNYPELESLSDDDRWLICSEGRPCLMKWLVLSPNTDA